MVEKRHSPSPLDGLARDLGTKVVAHPSKEHPVFPQEHLGRIPTLVLGMGLVVGQESLTSYHLSQVLENESQLS